MATENTNLSNYDLSKLPDASSFRFGLVVSEWNSQITDKLLKGVLKTLTNCKVLDSNVIINYVPGSFELIFGSKKMQEQQVDVVIAVGSVIKGETQHFNFVCDGVTQGIKDLNVLNNVPAYKGRLASLEMREPHSRTFTCATTTLSTSVSI